MFSWLANWAISIISDFSTGINWFQLVPNGHLSRTLRKSNQANSSNQQPDEKFQIFRIFLYNYEFSYLEVIRSTWIQSGRTFYNSQRVIEASLGNLQRDQGHRHVIRLSRDSYSTCFCDQKVKNYNFKCLIKFWFLKVVSSEKPSVYIWLNG